MVTAAELLSLAAFDEGRFAQAIPSFGSERMGAPVMAFCRIDDRPIRTRQPVDAPSAVVVGDATLLHQADLLAGVIDGGTVLVNTSRPLSELGVAERIPAGVRVAVATVAATELGREHLGRPLPSAALLGGLAALTNVVSLDALAEALRSRFAGELGEANVRAATAGFAAVSGRRMREEPAVAMAVAACRPRVICAYPITPQTHIVEALGVMVASGELAPCRFINVESEFAAMSVAIGASATGARAYTATSSQGLLFMAEAVYNAGGLGLPVVMTLANRAVGAPINIWNDHSDAMAVRDAGWVQLFAADNQQAADLHVVAFALAEELSVPVMVCMDGFVLTHAVEAIEVPGADQVDRYLPPYEPRQVLDPDDPMTIGAMVGPDAFQEVRYLAHARLLDALDAWGPLADRFGAEFGRHPGGPVAPYRTEGADVVVVAMGSVLGTLAEAVDALRADGLAVGSLGVTVFRPFPAAAVAQALAGSRSVVVLDRAVSPGFGGVLATDVAMALSGRGVELCSVVAGLGGRPVTEAALRRIGVAALEGTLPARSFCDLDEELVAAERARAAATRRAGPSAEGVLRHRARRPAGEARR